jgi:hypothetical protein
MTAGASDLGAYKLVATVFRTAAEARVGSMRPRSPMRTCVRVRAAGPPTLPLLVRAIDTDAVA